MRFYSSSAAELRLDAALVFNYYHFPFFVFAFFFVVACASLLGRLPFADEGEDGGLALAASASSSLSPSL